MQSRQSQNENEISKNIKSETISQLAHRHIRDQNHTTTDEELRNARIELNENFDISLARFSGLAAIHNDTVLPPLSDSNTKKDPVPNPYNILK